MAQSTFWGRYDIRAVVGDNFSAAQYFGVGQAFSRFMTESLQPAETPWVAIGQDARLHSPELAKALIEGLTQAGVNVVDLGLSTSPIVYFSEHLHDLNAEFPALVATLTVTASHNPSEYNGLKFTFQKRTLEEAEFQRIQALYFDHLTDAPLSAEKTGIVRKFDIRPDYQAWFVQHFGQIGKSIKIVVDSGNATAGIIAPDLLKALGCDVVDIFTEPDGRFPNHHPDPCVHKNLRFLKDEVLKTSADIGVAFDGDSDRLGVMDEKGQIVSGDQITLFLADELLRTLPGSTVVFDIKSTQTLFDYMHAKGGKPQLAPSGHVFMKRVMKDQDIPLGGELSGHIFFRDRHWGFDDALYAACRMIEALAHCRQMKAGYQLSDFMGALPQTIISEEIRIHCARPEGLRLIEDLQARVKEDPDYFGSKALDVLTLDGLRVNVENGFILLRVSNTEPCITLRYEAPNAEIYAKMQARIDELCGAYEPASH